VALPLSYRRAQETSTTDGSATVTVCTNHLALVDLAKDGVPIPVPHPGGDTEFLFGQVIEIEHDRVCLPAVDAGMLAEKRDQEPHPLIDKSLFPPPRRRDVALTVGKVVLSVVGRATGAAVGVTLRRGPAAPCECGGSLDLTASTAPAIRIRIGHEHMFPVA
jgi:hypothetical protein